MIPKKTNELLAKAFSRTTSLKGILARPFGVNAKTIDSWARPKANDLNPSYTGKGNPLDRVEKLLDELHVYDPEMAREIAEHFSIYVDELDRRAGFDEGDQLEHPCRAVARVVESHSKLVKQSLSGCDDPREVSRSLDLTGVLKSSVIQLEACLRRVLQNEGEEGAN